MKVTRTVRYGLRALVEIAKHRDEDSKITKRRIAESIDVTLSFLENILAQLCKTGLILSTTGVYGGYELNKLPTDIKVSDIFNSLEEDYSLVNCILDEGSCSFVESCPNRNFWSKLYQNIDNIFNNVTLQNIIDGNFNF
jgi:Rrf2 family transcriptional regulator, cysteine metabolism repressor